MVSEKNRTHYKDYQKHAAVLQSIKASLEVCPLRRPWRFSDQIKNSNGIITLAVPTDQRWVRGGHCGASTEYDDLH